ncbi:hypothetical protein, partial [Acetobacter tropicalis]
DAIAKTVNQIAKSQKLPAKHINQRFFDPSRSMVAIVLVRRFCNRREPVTVTFSVFDSVPALESEACFITFDATES